MTRYVDLQRQFRDLTRVELEDSEHLASLNGNEFGPAMSWSQLLEHPRVVILAEAGSGKTMEMAEQAKRLVHGGKCAFFVPLESLDRDPLPELLDHDDRQRFEAWIQQSGAPAWFFLDAVDELKLTRGKLDRALTKVSQSLRPHLGRTRFVISCRPNDWRHNVDAATVIDRLPIPIETNTAELPPEDKFRQPLSDAKGVSSRKSAARDAEEIRALRTVILLPLSERQIRRYAEHFDVLDTKSFLEEIRRQNAWTFARRPLDLMELISTWAAFGKLGTRAEQHEANINAKLRDHPDRPDAGILADARARMGAERLALALALTRTRTLQSPEQLLEPQRAHGVLDPATVLRDWTERERQTLLRRALFDPATFGRVRFHHRSVQEYLAACRLRTLRASGMSTKAAFRFFFSELYGVKIVYPTMRGIVAWLALWDDAIRRELTRREPEALLSNGDPESLDIDARVELLTAFAEAYGDGGSRGITIPIEEVRRLARPDMGPVVRKLWGENGPLNPDVCQLLIDVIWQGRIATCADLAHAAALSPELDAHNRLAAIRALIACGEDHLVRGLAQRILSSSLPFPESEIPGLAADLFPNFISVEEFALLIERTNEPEDQIGGFRWAAQTIAESLPPNSEHACQLRDKFSEMIWNGRASKQEAYSPASRFGPLTGALATLCTRQLEDKSSTFDLGLTRAAILCVRFGKDEFDAEKRFKALVDHFATRTDARSTTFWIELSIMDELTPSDNHWTRLYHVQIRSLLAGITEADRSWLEAALSDGAHPERRPVALHALLNLWFARRGSPSEKSAIASLLNGDSALEELLAQRTALPPRDKESEKLQRELKAREREHIRQDAKRLEDWERWRAQLLSNPAGAFSPENRDVTLRNLYTWLSQLHREQNRFNCWNKAAIAEAFNADIAERAAAAFKDIWRITSPQLWSTRSPDERNSTPFSWMYGLVGLAVESSSPRWADKLSPIEARIASAYATLEMNEFAPFLPDLVVAHPDIVDEVIGGELAAELNSAAAHVHLPTLQNTIHADDPTKRLLLHRLVSAISDFPRALDAKVSQKWIHHLEVMIRAIGQVGNPNERNVVAAECASRYEVDPTGPLSSIWLRGLFRLDPPKGTEALETTLSAALDADGRDRAVGIFAFLFGGHEPLSIAIDDKAQRASILGRLVRLAYRFVQRADDQSHSGVYTPNTRDNAEHARNYLLSALLDSPGVEARRVILQLAQEPDFSHFPDRLRLFARRRAAEDAEFRPYDAADLAALEARFEVPPHDRDGLFTVMFDRLEDLAHDLAHHDFTDRRTVRCIRDEAEMQRTLAWRLHAMANGAYTVSREDEVADSKRTDIRLSALRGGLKAVVEIKIADKRWSVTDFELALENQLLGQYLRHDMCKAGCLLLTYDGSKSYWVHPTSGSRMTFSRLIDHLGERARALEAGANGDVRIGVFGLDLTDPYLAPAHR